jgi:hypothetical protein
MGALQPEPVSTADSLHSGVPLKTDASTQKTHCQRDDVIGI